MNENWRLALTPLYEEALSRSRDGFRLRAFVCWSEVDPRRSDADPLWTELEPRWSEDEPCCLEEACRSNPPRSEALLSKPRRRSEPEPLRLNPDICWQLSDFTWETLAANFCAEPESRSDVSSPFTEPDGSSIKATEEASYRGLFGPTFPTPFESLWLILYFPGCDNVRKHFPRLCYFSTSLEQQNGVRMYRPDFIK